MKVSIVTSYRNKKREQALPVRNLYKSSRITAVYNHKDDTDMSIISTEHGLVTAERIIRSYDRVMDEKKC